GAGFHPRCGRAACARFRLSLLRGRHGRASRPRDHAYQCFSVFFSVLEMVRCPSNYSIVRRSSNHGGGRRTAVDGGQWLGPPMNEDTALKTSPAPQPAVLDEEGRKETELERYDRNLTELMGELRVALPGVQVLFAFLLVAPFNQRFGTVSMFERRLYLCALLLTLLASILLIAPTMIHRLHFQLGAKAYIVHTANRLTIAGLAVFAVAMTAAVLLVTHYLFGPTTAIITTAVVVGGFALTWFVLPMRSRHACLLRDRQRDQP